MSDALLTGPDERELLRRYVEANDVQAFRQLIDAHRDMVFSVCRRILRNAADAEDAAQDCFLQLARKAATLKSPIAGWMHQVALYVALDLRDRKAQREGRETMAAKMRSDSGDPHWQELCGVVDDAVSRLPEKLRVPVVLHYLESRTQEEVAAQLRITQPAVSQRLAKGLELLRKRLKRQGFAVTAAALAALLSAHAIEASPPALSDSAVKIGFSALATGVKAAGGKALAIGGISMFKASFVVAASAAALVAGGVVVHAVRAQPAVPPAAVQTAPNSGFFPPGDYVITKALEQITEPQAVSGSHDPAMGRTRKVTVTEKWISRISASDEAGNKKMSLTCSRIKLDSDDGKKKQSYDSDAAVDKADPEQVRQAVSMQPRLETKLIAILGPDGSITQVQNVGAANNASVGSLGQKFVEQYFGAGSKMFPPAPMKIGQEWETQESLAVPQSAAIDYKRKNRLAGLTDTPQGQIAKILGQGALTRHTRELRRGEPVKGAMETGSIILKPGPMTWAVVQSNVQLTSELEINLKTAMLVRSQVRRVEDMASTDPMPSGGTVNAVVKSTEITTIELCEATPDDLKSSVGVAMPRSGDGFWVASVPDRQRVFIDTIRGEPMSQFKRKLTSGWIQSDWVHGPIKGSTVVYGLMGSTPVYLESDAKAAIIAVDTILPSDAPAPQEKETPLVADGEVDRLYINDGGKRHFLKIYAVQKNDTGQVASLIALTYPKEATQKEIEAMIPTREAFKIKRYENALAALTNDGLTEADANHILGLLKRCGKWAYFSPRNDEQKIIEVTNADGDVAIRTVGP